MVKNGQEALHQKGLKTPMWHSTAFIQYKYKITAPLPTCKNDNSLLQTMVAAKLIVHLHLQNSLLLSFICKGALYSVFTKLAIQFKSYPLRFTAGGSICLDKELEPFLVPKNVLKFIFIFAHFKIKSHKSWCDIYYIEQQWWKPQYCVLKFVCGLPRQSNSSLLTLEI